MARKTSSLVIVDCRPAEISHALLNLLSNAFEACENAGAPTASEKRILATHDRLVPQLKGADVGYHGLPDAQLRNAWLSKTLFRCDH